MRVLLQLLCSVALMSSVGCREVADIKAAEARAKDLVARRATTNEVTEALGAAPIQVYSRNDALEYLNQQPTSKQWKTMVQYSMAYEFKLKMPVADFLIYFDEQGRAANYYINIQ